MRYIIQILVLAILFTSCTKEKPNVVLIVVDDLGWTDLSCYGSDLYQTPNIDNLANSGILFTDAYASCTVCSPTRASIMTGKYPARINCTDWISGHKKPFAQMKIPEWTQYMAEEEHTLAEAFKQAGYSTIHIGKWHLGETENYWPENQGFNINIGGYKVGAPQKKNGGNGYFPPYLNPKLSDGPEGEYLTERLSLEAVKFIDNQIKKDKPFFMNLWFYSVHTPLQAKKIKIEKYKNLIDTTANHYNPVYAAMIEHLDDAVGAVIQKLKETGIEENTIILFTSDNGGLCGNYENRARRVTSNNQLRSGKGDMYEGGVRVPFIAKWPGKIPNGKINATPVISMDIYPTLINLTGLKGNETHNVAIDGQDISSILLRDESISREAIYWHYPHYHLEGAKPYSAIRKGDWKLIQVYENKNPELYNLKEDIGETTDLVSKHPEKVTELLSNLNKWKEAVGAQEPSKNPLFHTEYEENWKSGEWRNKSDEEYLIYLKANKKE